MHNLTRGLLLLLLKHLLFKINGGNSYAIGVIIPPPSCTTCAYKTKFWNDKAAMLGALYCRPKAIRLYKVGFGYITCKTNLRLDACNVNYMKFNLTDLRFNNCLIV